MAQTPADVTSIREAMDQANRRFVDAFNAGDYEGATAAVYTEQARVIPPDAPVVQGHAAIAQFWQAAAAQLALQNVDLSTVDVEVQGDFACELGRATLTLGSGDQVVARYVVVWKREHGQWRWHVDIWNIGP